MAYKIRTQTRLKRLLNSIVQRCNNRRQSNFRYYGARGIECRITLKQLENLWVRDSADAMEQPSIDRINPDGHYTRRNCRFIEMQVNRSQLRM